MGFGRDKCLSLRDNRGVNQNDLTLSERHLSSEAYNPEIVEVECPFRLFTDN